MMFFARAVITGFALSLGAAVFKKVAPKLGLDDKSKDKDKESTDLGARDAATDPELQSS